MLPTRQNDMAACETARQWEEAAMLCPSSTNTLQEQERTDVQRLLIRLKDEQSVYAFCGMPHTTKASGVLDIWGRTEENGSDETIDSVEILQKMLLELKIELLVSPVGGRRAVVKHAINYCDKATSTTESVLPRLALLSACLARLGAHTPLLFVSPNGTTIQCFKSPEPAIEIKDEMFGDLIRKIASLGILLLQEGGASPLGDPGRTMVLPLSVDTTAPNLVIKSLDTLSSSLRVNLMPPSCCEALMLLGLCFGNDSKKTDGTLLRRLYVVARNAAQQLRGPFKEGRSDPLMKLFLLDTAATGMTAEAMMMVNDSLRKELEALL